MRQSLVLLLILLAAAGAGDAYAQKQEVERDRARRLLVRGLTMLQNDDAESALQSLEMAHQLAPNEPGILASIAAAYAETGDYPAAIFYADRALSLDAANAELQLEAALIRIRAGELASAAGLLEQLSREYADDPGIATTAARYLAEIGYRDEATRVLVDQLRFQRAEPVVLKAIADADLSRNPDIQRALRTIVGGGDLRPNEAYRIARSIELYGLDEPFHDVALRLHEISGVPGSTDHAVAGLTSTRPPVPEHDDSVSSDAAQLEAAIESDPRDINNWIAAARAYIEVGLPKASWRIAEEGLILFPSNEDLLVAGALSLLEMERDDAAGSLLQTAEVEHSDGAILQAYLSAKSDNVDAARQYLGRVDDEHLSPALFAYRSITFALLGDVRHAETDAERALEQAPSHPIALEAAGRVRFLQRDSARAIELLEQASAIGSDRPRVLGMLAEVLDETGRADAAADVRARLVSIP